MLYLNIHSLIETSLKADLIPDRPIQVIETNQLTCWRLQKGEVKELMVLVHGVIQEKMFPPVMEQ